MTDRAQVCNPLAEALESYLRDRDEAHRAQAYELGRRALSAGMGVLEMAMTEHEALGLVLARSGAPERTMQAYRQARDLLAEGLTPFELTHRGFQDANEALRSINERLEAEMDRVAHLLHSETSQLMAAAQIVLNDLERSKGASASGCFQKLQDILRRLEDQVRQLSHEIRPTILDHLGLLAAIEFLGQGIAERAGFSVSVEGPPSHRFPQEVERALYRVVQEALNNVAKHAKSSRASVCVRQDNGSLLCTIADDGVGFDHDGVMNKKGERGLGFAGMRLWLAQLGGTFDVNTSPGRGTEVCVAIPLRSSNQ